MIQDIQIEEMLKDEKEQNLVLIDVRSPSEYQESTIPGSMNIPLFDDEERAEVGTIYRKIGADKAKERGLEIVSAKLPQFMKAFATIQKKKVVFCWRGGMRSKTVATLLDLMNIPVARLQGGYRSYRKWVVETLDHIELPAELFVLNGYTGTGKTIILQKLQEKEYPIIDLERLANHRGSVFGQIGLQEPNNQKTFEALLLQDLLRIQEEPYFLIEAESKRIGKILLPNFIIDKKEKSKQIFIQMPIEQRVQHILKDYCPIQHHAECMDSFQKIKKRIHTPIATQIEKDLQTGNFTSVAYLLLKYYYDPLYEYTAKQYPKKQTITIQAANIDEATEKLCHILKK